VDEDSYLLQLSRYVHRNPIEVREAMVAKLEDYPWSSYPAYINGAVSPDWLNRERTYQMLGHKQRYRGYRRFVEKGVDEDIKRFYSKGNILSVLGNKEFKQERQEEFEETDIVKLRQILQDKPTINEMMEIICRVTKHSEAEINVLVAGKRTNNPFRAFAIYYCSKYCIENKQLIAGYFGLAHPGSLSHSISRIQNEIAQGVWINEVNRIEKELYIVK
jgi:putative transposase